uniref:ribosomal protein S3 n=1 Tax=Cyperus esculentus TaxID=1053340 RepID=UPI001D12A628|nr:ribosomal protein S3 [Cyperus esculentus]UAL49986.1 ribosomal protein S3 [Cyperus esculentus]
MARKGNPISVRLDLNRSSDPSWFSEYYYSKLVYQDVNLRSYFGTIQRPPTILTFGFRLGRCIILHFPKRTFIHFFIPRRPLRLKRRNKLRPGKAKGQWRAFDKVEQVSSGTEKERKEVGGQAAAGQRVESIRLDDREKQNDIRIWPKKMQRYGYHDRSSSITTESLDSLLGLYRYGKVFEDFLLFNHSPFETLLLTRRESPSDDDPMSHLLNKFPPSFNYLVMLYLLHTKKKIHFDPVHVLNHFVASGVAEPGGGAKEESLDNRIRSRIAFFVESSTSEKKFLAQAKKRLIHFIRLANDFRFAGTRKPGISLFPFFGATLLFLKERGALNFKEYIKLEKQFYDELTYFFCRRKDIECRRKDNNKFRKKFIDQGRKGAWIKSREKKDEKKKNHSFFHEVEKMRSILSKRTNTCTLIESVKIKSVYQSASLIAQDISFQPRNNQISFRSIFSKIVKDISLRMPEGVEGIRISCSGRLGGAEIARTECGKYGKTSCNVFNQKIDYASAKVSTRYGILGVKVWISYSQKNGCALSETYEI